MPLTSSERWREIARYHAKSSWPQWYKPNNSLPNEDPDTVAAAHKRAREPEARDLTGQILGDPPKGRSALDKKVVVKKSWWDA
jgi:hypothetical protein